MVAKHDPNRAAAHPFPDAQSAGVVIAGLGDDRGGGGRAVIIFTDVRRNGSIEAGIPIRCLVRVSSCIILT
jgi:hypothetical protein